MYLLLTVIFLILFSCLVIYILKSTTNKIKLFFAISLISVPFIALLALISYYYKKINPSAIILVLITVFVLAMFYYRRHLH